MKTALYEAHKKLGAKFIPFAGWEMPLQYRGIIEEHAAVRKAVGVFDVSHMGIVDIKGPGTVAFLEYLSVNSVRDKPFGKAFYTVLCDETGGSIDDLLVFMLDPSNAFLIANAVNREKDLQHLQTVAKKFQVEISPRYDSAGILSVQGPMSRNLIHRLFPQIAPLQHMQILELHQQKITLSRTGYTGEEGYEIFAPDKTIVRLWEQIAVTGAEFGIEPCGLGARDLLRLEMGYALYGHELSATIAPLESVAHWVVKLSEHDFLGREALAKIASSPQKRRAIALQGIERIPAREGYPIWHEDQNIGIITSGTFSPELQKPIALGLVHHALSQNDKVEVEIRQKRYPFQIVPLPFIARKLK